MQANNKRIAKNSLMLYIRMGITTLIGLYTSRILLNALGVDNFGIYGLVGSVVGIIGFLNASMSSASSRFITFELGGGTDKSRNETFNASMFIHVIIGFIILIFLETAGLWFVNAKLNIPSDRMYAANIVYQLSIIAAFFSVTQSPYNACIVAHEKFGVYAYGEILNSVLKLGIVYILLIASHDRLILYGILTLIVSVVMLTVYRVYCIRKFPECKLHRKINFRIVGEMVGFVGNSFLAHLSYTLRIYGCNFALNMVFGVVVNAASSLAATVINMISLFSDNVATAFKPQIIKEYANNNYEAMSRNIVNSVNISLTLFMVLFVPFFLNIDYVIYLWLGQIPEYSVQIMRISIISVLISIISGPLYTGIMASGKIKGVSITQSVNYILIPFLCYLIAYLTKNVSLAYSVIILSHFVNMINVVYWYCKICSGLNTLKLVLRSSIVSIIGGGLALGICEIINTESSFTNLIISIFVAISVILPLMFFSFDKNERHSILAFVKNKIR